jgi:hypothetical protein
LLYCPSRPWTSNPPASASLVLGLQECTTMLSYVALKCLHTTYLLHGNSKMEISDSVLTRSLKFIILRRKKWTLHTSVVIPWRKHTNFPLLHRSKMYILHIIIKKHQKSPNEAISIQKGTDCIFQNQLVTPQAQQDHRNFKLKEHEELW